MIRFSIFSLSNKKLKNILHSAMTLTLDDLNDCIKRLVTVKSSDLRSCLATKKHSSPYSKIGIDLHLQLINWRVTSSDATLPIFPKMALVEWLKDRLACVRLDKAIDLSTVWANVKFRTLTFPNVVPFLAKSVIILFYFVVLLYFCCLLFVLCKCCCHRPYKDRVGFMALTASQ